MDSESYASIASGFSFDVFLKYSKCSGPGTAAPGTNVAAATTSTAGTSGSEPAVGSPGNQGQIFGGPVTTITAPPMEIG